MKEYKLTELSKRNGTHSFRQAQHHTCLHVNSDNVHMYLVIKNLQKPLQCKSSPVLVENNLIFKKKIIPLNVPRKEYEGSSRNL